MSKRRVFSREYELAAVKKVLGNGLSVMEVARDLGIRDSLIHNWKRAFEADGTLATEVQDSTGVRDPAFLETEAVCERAPLRQTLS